MHIEADVAKTTLVGKEKLGTGSKKGSKFSFNENETCLHSCFECYSLGVASWLPSLKLVI